MAEDNGNGQLQAIEIDVANEYAFRVGVVKYLQLIHDRTEPIPRLVKTVHRHENIVRIGGLASIPLVIAVQQGVKHLMGKLGW